MSARVDVKIIEQPALDSIRFRYQSDDRSSGSIMGINSKASKPTFPSLSIHTFDYIGPVIVIASCVTKDKPYRPHPHCLVGENCTKGICRIDFVTNNDCAPKIISFRNLGIECARHIDVEKNLTEREKSNVDPFRTGFTHKSNKKDVNMHEVRLCFQVFLTLDAKRLPVKPIVSDPIRNNLKALPDLVIFEISDVASPVHGGKKIMIFCDKVLKGDVQIRFFQEDDNNVMIFDETIAVQSKNIHRQHGISFYTPKYKFLDICDPVTVLVQLVRPSDGRRSMPLTFQYIPDRDVVSNRFIKGKKRKIEENHELYLFLKTFSENQTEESEENDMKILSENSLTLPLLYNVQLPSLSDKQIMNQTDQRKENHQICEIGANKPQSLSNHLKQVRRGKLNREIVDQNQQGCEFHQLNNSPTVDQRQQNPQNTLSNNQLQHSCSNYFQQVEPNQQIHQVSSNIMHPAYNKQLQLVDQSQQNYNLHQLSTDSTQSSCKLVGQVDQVDQTDQNCQLFRTNHNQPQPLYSNHQLVDQSQQNGQICEINKYQAQPSCSNYFQEVGENQPNCEYFQGYPTSDLSSNSDMQLLLPHASCYDSNFEYQVNSNLYHEIQISSPTVSSQAQSLIRQCEQGYYPIQIPSNNCNNSENLMSDQESRDSIKENHPNCSTSSSDIRGSDERCAETYNYFQ